jgi:hypothetical protein
VAPGAHHAKKAHQGVEQQRRPNLLAHRIGAVPRKSLDIDGDSCATYVIASDPDSAFDEAMKIHPRPDAQLSVAQLITPT